MNKTNMRHLVKHLLSPDRAVGFAMEDYFRHNGRSLDTAKEILHAAETHACGTAACIAGHAALLAWQTDAPKSSRGTMFYTAERWLDLSDKDACRLFMGRWSENRLRDITLDEAVAELRRLIAKD